MKKKVLMLIVLVGMCFSLSGCLDAKKEEFAVDDLRITLTDEFKETDQDEGFTAYFESDDTGVAIVKETYSALEVKLSVSLDPCLHVRFAPAMIIGKQGMIVSSLVISFVNAASLKLRSHAAQYQ